MPTLSSTFITPLLLCLSAYIPTENQYQPEREYRTCILYPRSRDFWSGWNNFRKSWDARAAVEAGATFDRDLWVALTPK